MSNVTIANWRAAYGPFYVFIACALLNTATESYSHCDFDQQKITENIFAFHIKFLITEIDFTYLCIPFAECFLPQKKINKIADIFIFNKNI